MMHMKLKFAGALAAALGFTFTSAHADNALENYLRNAAPIMHYSCASVVKEAGDNEERIFNVVRLMIGVSLHNRQIDINDYDTSEDNVKEIKARFIEELKQACAKDNNALLAGIVDASVRKILVD